MLQRSTGMAESFSLARALMALPGIGHHHLPKFELTIGSAFGFRPRDDSTPSLQSNFRLPKFFIRVKSGDYMLFQTQTSPRTLSPEWNEKHVVSVNPTQALKFEVFRDSSIRSSCSLGSFEATMQELQSQGQMIRRSVSEKSQYVIALTLLCREIGTRSPVLERKPEIQHVRESESAPLTGLKKEFESVSRAEVSLRPAPVSQLERSREAGSRTFALVIGIDKYQSPKKPQLHGAANDARQMNRLLQAVYGVPESQISLLCDYDATRKRIIAEFKALIANTKIQRGDAIIIFFAGHGSRAPAPDDWRIEGGMVETICPVDEEFGSDNSVIHGIPDRTIAALVDQLSKEKGGNITLIFDCCHSGGIARGDGKQVTRSAETTARLPASIDEDILAAATVARGGGRKAGFSAVLEGYVLLAACRPNEEAKEATNDDDDPCGAFSKVLLRHLRKSGPATTYFEIARSAARDLKDHFQHPVCEGEFKHRPLFNGIAVRQDAKLFAVTNNGQGSYRVEAGAVHGITTGSRFSVRTLDASSGVYREVGVLEAHEVSINSSILRVADGADLFDVSKDSKAELQSWGPSDALLHVYLDGLPTTWVDSTPHHIPRYRTTSSQSDSALVLRQPGNGRITFERGRPVAEHTKEPLRPSIEFTPQVLQRTLNIIGDFHYHLARRNRSILEGKVKLCIHKLDKNENAGGDLFVDSRAVVTPATDYGFRIVNESNFDIFPYLFFFDTTNYSVEKWYGPPTDNASAPLLRSEGKPRSLSVGFENCPFGGPFEFTIPDGAKNDLGFLKLFVSTCEVDMDSLVQDSPFLVTDDPNSGPARGGGRSRSGGQKTTVAWDTSCYTLVIGHENMSVT